MVTLQQPYATGLCGESVRYSQSKASCSGPTGGITVGGNFHNGNACMFGFRREDVSLAPGLWEM